MTAPTQARNHGDGRVYVWPPGIAPTEMVVPSVTTILKQLSKGQVLINWAAKCVAEYAVEHILSWQELPPDDAVFLLKGAPKRSMVKAGDKGTAVHTAIDLYIGSAEPVIEDLDLLPYVGGALAFLEDLVEQVVESEVTIYNRTYQYAGTTDAICLLKDGRTAIVDWKSGKAIYPDVALQLVGYANGEFIGTDQGEELPLPQIDLGIVVHLPGDGTYTAKEVELTPRLWKTFQALRTLQRWRDDFEADALGKAHKGSAKSADTTKGGL